MFPHLGEARLWTISCGGLASAFRSLVRVSRRHLSKSVDFSLFPHHSKKIAVSSAGSILTMLPLFYQLLSVLVEFCFVLCVSGSVPPIHLHLCPTLGHYLPYLAVVLLSHFTMVCC